MTLQLAHSVPNILAIGTHYYKNVCMYTAPSITSWLQAIKTQISEQE